MTERIVRSIPRELPHARLYLDDIEEITHILLDAYGTTAADDLDQGQPAVTYRFADRETDSIEDLRKRGGSVSNLTIRVKKRFKDGQIEFYRSLKPTLEAYSLDEQQRWSLYSRVKVIFDARRLVLKNAVLDLPSRLRGALFLLAALVFPPLLVALTWKMKRTPSLLILGGYYLTCTLIGFVLYRSSRVYFIDSHQRSKLSAEAKRRYVRDIVILILGVVIGKGGEILLEKFLK